ncbi:MAG: VTT domain-containing protein [Planctomycetota bacterium]
MFDWLLQTLAEYPYLGAMFVFLLCGLGLPLPEEIVLVSAGYACFKDFAHVGWMIAACASAILAGDALPFVLGRLFGPRLLRLRPLRLVVNRRRLAKLDVWFRRRGDLAVFFARFVPGLRVVAYFTAGTLRMRGLRFLVLDLAGIALVCPPLIWVGYHFGDVIDDAILRVRQVERGILWTVVLSVVVVLLVWTLRQRRRQRDLARGPAETYVAPSVPTASPGAGKQEGGSPQPTETEEPSAAERSPAPTSAGDESSGSAPSGGLSAGGAPAEDAPPEEPATRPTDSTPGAGEPERPPSRPSPRDDTSRG